MLPQQAQQQQQQQQQAPYGAHMAQQGLLQQQQQQSTPCSGIFGFQRVTVLFHETVSSHRGRGIKTRIRN